MSLGPEAGAARTIAFDGATFEVDAALVAEGFGISPVLFLERLRAGEITSLCERGQDADSGRYRLTFFSRHRRFRLIVDGTGAVAQRSSLDFGDAPLPRTARARPTPPDAARVSAWVR